LTLDIIFDTIIAGGDEMASVDKLIEKMHNQPHGVRMAEADKVLRHNGYRFDRQTGSHCQYINQKGDVITVKNENPLKVAYIKDILSRIEK
jgi:predicted RNA binding protein YcfA (HicA-like mRNA interferase family)